MPDPYGFLRHDRQLPARRPVPLRLLNWREVYRQADEQLVRQQATRRMRAAAAAIHAYLGTSGSPVTPVARPLATSTSR